MLREIKNQFDIGFIDERIEVIDKHDWTDKPSPFDCTYFYDVIDHSTGKKYAWLTYSETVRLVNGERVDKKIVFFLNQKMVDEMFQKSNYYCTIDLSSIELIDLLDLDFPPSELENSLVDLILEHEDFCNLRFIDDSDAWDFAVGTLNNIIAADDIDEDYREYRDKCIKNKRPLNGYRSGSAKKYHKFLEGDIVAGKFNALEIIKKYPRDCFNRAVFDVKELRTGTVFKGINARDIKRIAKNDFPIIGYKGIYHTLQEWSKILKLHPDSIRKYYRRHNNSIEAVTKRLEELIDYYDIPVSPKRNFLENK